MIKPTFIQEKLLTYICQHCIGGWGGGDYAQIVPLKITIVVPNGSLVIFWTVLTSVPTTFDLHCRFVLDNWFQKANHKQLRN